MLPAIVFVFSRAGCDQAVDQCVAAGLRLTTLDRAPRRCARIAERHTAALSDDDLDVLGYDSWLAGLEAGVAAHHAGMVPPMKEAVEEAFAAGLLKVVFATETLSLGINMPARIGRHREAVEVHRRAPRVPDAGRVHAARGARRPARHRRPSATSSCSGTRSCAFEQVAGLASRRTYALTSSFRPTYNMAANLVRRYPPEQARHLLNLSFAQYHADRDVVVARAPARTRAASSSRGPRRGRDDPGGRRAGVPRGSSPTSTRPSATAHGRRRRRGSRRSGPATSCSRRGAAARSSC